MSMRNMKKKIIPIMLYVMIYAQPEGGVSGCLFDARTARLNALRAINPITLI